MRIAQRILIYGVFLDFQSMEKKCVEKQVILPIKRLFTQALIIFRVHAIALQRHKFKPRIDKHGK